MQVWDNVEIIDEDVNEKKWVIDEIKTINNWMLTMCSVITKDYEWRINIKNLKVINNEHKFIS